MNYKYPFDFAVFIVLRQRRYGFIYAQRGTADYRREEKYSEKIGVADIRKQKHYQCKISQSA